MKANLNRCAGLGLGVVAAVSMAVAQPAGQSPLNPPANGPRRGDTTWNALTHATVHVKPGEVLEDVTVVIRDGRIEAVGKGDAPGGARVWDCTGLQVYAGFVDPFVEVDAPAPDRSAPGVHWNSKVTPQRNALDGTGVDERTAESMRKLGFTAAAIAPRGGIFRGSAAVVSLAKPATELSADRPPVFVKNVYQVIGFESGRAFGGERPVDATPTPAAPAAQRQQQETPDIARWSRYPDSQMGAIALMRQTLIDADWQSEARKAGGVLATNCLDTLTDTGERERLCGEPRDDRAQARAGAVV
jgi:imidazolonepropionase-like amidohydrolase